MKSILIHAPGFQKKWDAKLTIALLLLFLAVACKKEGKPTQSSIRPQDLDFKNLAWTASATDSGFRLHVTTLSERYSLDRLEAVYIYDWRTCWSPSDGFLSCIDRDIELQKLPQGGDYSGIIYYEIVNRTIFLYVKRTSNPYFNIVHQEVVVRWK